MNLKEKYALARCFKTLSNELALKVAPPETNQKQMQIFLKKPLFENSD